MFVSALGKVEGVFAQYCVWQEGCVLQGGVRWRGRGERMRPLVVPQDMGVMRVRKEPGV